MSIENEILLITSKISEIESNIEAGTVEVSDEEWNQLEDTAYKILSFKNHMLPSAYNHINY